MGNKDKKFNNFKRGDLVEFIHNLGYGVPGVMMVEGESREFGFYHRGNGDDDIVSVNDSGDRKLLGIRCIWFGKNGEKLSGVFHSKDLVFIGGVKRPRARLPKVVEGE